MAGVRLRGRRRCLVGAARTANQTLLITLVTPEQRAASFALGRVGLNLGRGSGATVAGFIVASAQHLRSFQTLYLFDAITYAASALIVLAMVPNRRVAAAHAGAVERGFRAVARDRKFLIVIAVNIVLIIVGYTLFANILPPFAKAHTRVGPAAIGILFLFNTSFIVIAQLPATRVVKRMRRAQAFAAASALWAIALLGVLLATLIHSELGATALLAGVATVFAIGECVHAVVLGPLIADLAPPHLLGRYISLYNLMVTGGLALGPAIGGAVLATSPDAVWWGGALVAAVIGAGFLLSGDRTPSRWPWKQVSPTSEKDLARRRKRLTDAGIRTWYGSRINDPTLAEQHKSANRPGTRPAAGSQMPGEPRRACGY